MGTSVEKNLNPAKPPEQSKLCCVCVDIPFILDVRLVDAPAEVTQDLTTFLLRCLP